MKKKFRTIVWTTGLKPLIQTIGLSGFLAQEPRFGAGQVAQKSPHFLWVSEVTLGTFSPPFLRLLRPSLPWCFPVRGLWFCAVFPRPRTAFWSGTSSSEISSFSMGFRSYVRHFFAAFFAPSPSFTAMVFPRPGAVVLRGLSSPKNRVLERDK